MGRPLGCRPLHGCGAHAHAVPGGVDHPVGDRCARTPGTGWHDGDGQYLSARCRACEDGGDVEPHHGRTGSARPRRRLAGERHYQLTEATLDPKPVQRPLPLLIGGGGEKVTLKITAEYADEWNHWGDAATMAQKGAILDAHCAAVGRDPREIQRSAAILLFIGRSGRTLGRVLRRQRATPLTGPDRRRLAGGVARHRRRVRGSRRRRDHRDRCNARRARREVRGNGSPGARGGRSLRHARASGSPLPMSSNTRRG